MRDFCFGDGLRRVIPLWRRVDAPVKNSERKNMLKMLAAVLLATSMLAGTTIAHSMGGGSGGGGGGGAGAGGGAGGGNWQTGLRPPTTVLLPLRAASVRRSPTRERRCRVNDIGARSAEAIPLVRGACAEVRLHTISPRIRRGCEAAGATPSRIKARRSGPMRSTK
jgi:hypothetical protein